MTDPFAAFDQRVNRRLGEMHETALVDSVAIDGQMTARGMLNSSGRTLRQLDNIKVHIDKAVDWALSEANKLPGQQDLTRTLIAPKLRENLTAHLSKLVGSVGSRPGMTMDENLLSERHAKLESSLAGDLSDFEVGLWHPRAIPQTGSSVTNTVNVQGSNNGVIQQAGQGSVQNASQVENAIGEFLAHLAAASIADDLKQELRAEVETLRIQLLRATPNRSVMQAAGDGLYQLALGVGGNILTPYAVTLLATLGIHVAS
jgi:hypothetical protein